MGPFFPPYIYGYIYTFMCIYYKHIFMHIYLCTYICSHILGIGSVFSPIAFNSPLMVAFKKVGYPEYRISQIGYVPLFSYKRFIKWEASCELNFSYEESENIDYLYEKRNDENNCVLDERILKFKNKMLFIIDPFNHIIMYNNNIENNMNNDDDKCQNLDLLDQKYSIRNHENSTGIHENSIHPHSVIIMLFDRYGYIYKFAYTYKYIGLLMSTNIGKYFCAYCIMKRVSEYI